MALWVDRLTRKRGAPNLRAASCSQFRTSGIGERMTFLNPLGLFGLLSVPVIVGLHLHLERNRRVIVSSMFLWSFLEAKFEGQKPKYIQLSWLLVLDIMVAVFLSLAFALLNFSIGYSYWGATCPKDHSY